MKKLVILFLAVAAFAACTKEGVAPNAEKALTRQPWNGDQVMINGEADTADFFGIKDVQITFKDDGTYTDKEISTGDEDSGKWELNDEETQLILEKGTADEEVYELLDCNKKKLRIKITEQGNTIEMTFLPAE